MRFLDLAGNFLNRTFNRLNDLYPFSYSILSGTTAYSRWEDKKKLVAILSNPAALKVFAMQADLFSMGRVEVKDKDGNVIENDPFLNLLNNPNPFQSGSQFLWDFMFWTMLGNANCYVDSRIVDNIKNKMYFLDPSKIEWPKEFVTQSDHLVFSDQTILDITKKPINYRYKDGSVFKFTMDRLINTPDLTNGLGNWYQGNSRVDALYKVISNAEHALDAKNINVRYSGKFLVGAANADVGKVGMDDKEKKWIEENTDQMESRVHAVKTPIQIRRFVENLAQQGLSEAYLADYFIIGNMYGIPRDVLEAYQSATYENQEKARAAHISYCLDPKGNQFMDSFEKFFGYNKTGKNICISWNHLPFMHVFEKERADVAKVKSDTLTSLLNIGVSSDEANQFLGTNFEIEPPTLVAKEALNSVQGILAIQASIVSGATSYDSAVNMLISIYGFTEQEAKNIIGEEKDETTSTTTEDESQETTSTTTSETE